MSATDPASIKSAEDAVVSPRLRPLHALMEMRRLIADKEDTTQVFEIMRALAGNSVRKGYLRLIATVEGGRIAYERQELVALLSDRERLKNLPRDSVGYAYWYFTEEQNISAQGLAEASRVVEADGIELA